MKEKYFNPDLLKIEKIVSQKFEIYKSDLCIRTRKSEIKEPRQICMWFRASYTNESMSKIGARYTGKKNKIPFDHATVHHAKNTINNICEINKNYREFIDGIKQETFIEYYNNSPWEHLKLLSEQIARYIADIGKTFDNIKDHPESLAAEFSALHFTLHQLNNQLRDRFTSMAEKSKG